MIARDRNSKNNEMLMMTTMTRIKRAMHGGHCVSSSAHLTRAHVFCHVTRFVDYPADAETREESHDEGTDDVGQDAPALLHDVSHE